MSQNVLMYIFYGFVAGFSEYTPLSASAHQALFPLLFQFNSNHPLLRFFVHAGMFGAVVYMYWQRISHIYREMNVIALSPRLRKRPPDMDAVRDARLAFIAVPVVLVGAVCSWLLVGAEVNLFWLGIFLVASAVLIYIPDYIPGGNRKGKTMSPLDGVLLGVCAALSVIPGVSCIGCILAVGQFRKCDRGYILDIGFLITALLVAISMVFDLIGTVFSGFAGISLTGILGCMFAAAASFSGGVAAIMMMRFLVVKSGFSAFAFYGWGLALFSYILYLMI